MLSHSLLPPGRRPFLPSRPTFDSPFFLLYGFDPRILTTGTAPFSRFLYLDHLYTSQLPTLVCRPRFIAHKYRAWRFFTIALDFAEASNFDDLGTPPLFLVISILPSPPLDVGSNSFSPSSFPPSGRFPVSSLRYV